MEQARIKRVQEMETLLNGGSQVLDALERAWADYLDAEEALERLFAYYESPLWLEDFDADRAGKLPQDLPRGVLTEDAVWDLLSQHHELLKQLRQKLT